MKLPIVKHILVFTTWGQKCPHSERDQFTFDNFQSNHPVVTSVGQLSEKDDIMTSNAQSLQTSESNLMKHQLQT